MNYNDIVDHVCNKIGETDDNAEARALDFVKARHKMIYQSFDWTASQDTISVDYNGTITGLSNADIALPNAEKVITARFNGEFLDPVSASYIFESHPEMLSQRGKPQFYWSRFDPTTRSTSIRLYPAPDRSGTLDALVKTVFDENTTELLIPGIEETIIAFVLADLWEYLRQIGKYQAKIQEAATLLQAAQQRDTPAAPKSRTTKNLTASGSTLSELADSVCDIVGRWEPDIRESIKERIRRNYQLLWDTELWPESLVIADVPIAPDQQQVVLPYIFDRIVAVRTNDGGPLNRVQPLKNNEISYFFQVAYNIFEQSGQPVSYAMIGSVATEVLPPVNEKLQLIASQPLGTVRIAEDFNVFLKGDSNGAELSEVLNLIVNVDEFTNSSGDLAPVVSINSYDTPLTISKPETVSSLTIKGDTTGRVLLKLGPKERERKHLRIMLEPSLNPRGSLPNVANPGRVLICGKRKVSQLLDDSDSLQLRNVNNIVINGAAADIFDRLGNGDMAAKYSQKAASQLQILINAETKQNAYTPKIVPYTENYRRRGFTDFLTSPGASTVDSVIDVQIDGGRI